MLGVFEQAVLLAVVRLGKDGYGRAIWKETAARLERDVTAGAVYTTLDRLEQKGLIASRLSPGNALRGGRPRRYYSLEAEGIRALNEARDAVKTIWHGLRWPLKGRT